MTKIQGFVFMLIVLVGFVALNTGMIAIEKKLDSHWIENNLKGRVHVIAEREHKSVEFGTVWVLEYMIDGHYYSPVFLGYNELRDTKRALGLETEW